MNEGGYSGKAASAFLFHFIFCLIQFDCWVGRKCKLGTWVKLIDALRL